MQQRRPYFTQCLTELGRLVALVVLNGIIQRRQCLIDRLRLCVAEFAGAFQRGGQGRDRHGGLFGGDIILIFAALAFGNDVIKHAAHLGAAEVMRRDFVANVSHEIRTPLTVLGGFVETLQTLPLSEHERERYLALMAQQAGRVQTLVSDLLTLSRLEGSPPPNGVGAIFMPTIMRQLEQEGRALSAVLNPLVEQLHKLVFVCCLEGEIIGTRNELFSAMSNLLSNAIRYTPPGGELHVRSLVLPDGRAEFSVQDTGPGIAPEHIPRLTERFYRVDRSRSRDTGGTGLGLAIVKHVVQRHGAEFKIESTLGKGSTFAIIFPASRVRFRPNTAPGGQRVA